MTRWWRAATAAAAFVCVATTGAFAQGGGASQTGTIVGKVSDASGGVLPGVTVTAQSPSMMGVQTAVTSESGTYRFPALPPGRYTLTFELPGFTPVKREGIDISVGFTANLTTEMGVATLQETVTVTGDSPVVDTSATRLQQNYKIEQLDSIPNARDMWALLSVTPGVQMSRIDVGGNRAGTQTPYRAYGYGGQDQQVRILVEGINITNGTGSSGTYQDYGAFEEVYIGTAAQGAEMPTPGVQTQMVGKSGGNQFSGEFYQDFQNNALESSNISDETIARWGIDPSTASPRIRARSNEILKYTDTNFSGGGPIRRDKIWWYGSYRRQHSEIDQVNIRFGAPFVTKIFNAGGKATYQVNQNNRFIGFFQWNKKFQPTRLGNSTYSYFREEDTRKQDDGSWVYKGEWNGTLNENMYLESRYGGFGYFFPLEANGSDVFRQDTGLRTSTGGDRHEQSDRERSQWTTAATWFKEGWGGSHTLKAGGELNREAGWSGVERIRANNQDLIFNNGVAERVILGFPTVSGPIGSKSSRKYLLSVAKVDQQSVFLSDQWTMGPKLTVNLGARYDRYRSHIPEQEQVAFTNGPVSLPARSFPAQTFFVWNSVVPRLGIVYNVDGKGATVVKANYGFYKHNPSFTIAEAANPNQGLKTITYTWTDRNGDRLYQVGEEGSVISDLTGPQGVAVAPDITQPYSHEISTFLERQVTGDVAARIGFVYKTNDNLWQQYQPFRPIEAYTAPFAFRDIGTDGRAGTADDRELTFRGIPTAQLGPSTSVIQNTDAIGRYKSVDAAVNRRMVGRWSLSAGFNFSWIKEHNNNYASNTVSPSRFPNSPNDTSLQEFTMWGLNAQGQWDAPFGFRVTPALRHQSGQPYGRTISVRAPAGLFYTGTVLAEPINTRRMDNITMVDVRTERAVPLGRRMRVRLFGDVFNVLNASPSDVIGFQSGPTFEMPSNIVAPRVVRLGFRLMW